MVVLTKFSFLFLLSEVLKIKDKISLNHLSFLLFLCDKECLERNGFSLTSYGYYLDKNKNILSKDLKNVIDLNSKNFCNYFILNENFLFLKKENSDNFNVIKKEIDVINDVIKNYIELPFDSLFFMCKKSYKEFQKENEILIEDIMENLDIDTDIIEFLKQEHNYNLI